MVIIVLKCSHARTRTHTSFVPEGIYSTCVYTHGITIVPQRLDFRLFLYGIKGLNSVTVFMKCFLTFTFVLCFGYCLPTEGISQRVTVDAETMQAAILAYHPAPKDNHLPRCQSLSG